MGIIQNITGKLEKKIINYPFLFKTYSYPYKYIVSNEIKLGKITPEDKVLNIGCGAIPFSAIYIARLVGGEVEAIDYDGSACIQAQKCIAKLNLTDKINIKKGNGINYEVNDFNVILVALQAEPKDKILDNLYNNTEPGTHLIFRKPRKQFKGQYDQLPTKYKIDDYVKQPMITFNKSVLYIN